MREDRLVFPIPAGTHWSGAKPILLPGMVPEEPKRLPSPRQKRAKHASPIGPTTIAAGGLRFAVTKPPESEPERKRDRRQKLKNDPRLVAAARELRDRYLERINHGALVPQTQARYEVARAIPDQPIALP